MVSAGMLRCGVTRTGVCESYIGAAAVADGAVVCGCGGVCGDPGGWHAGDMAYFSADPRPPGQVWREVVRSAEVFVGVVGFRYGSPVTDRPELSYTELEFQEASAVGTPRLVFLLGEDMAGHRKLFQDVGLQKVQERPQRVSAVMSRSGHR
jgi:Domain of unknown function (DUF4062)